MSEQTRPHDFDFEQSTEYLIFHNLEFCPHHGHELARWPLHITIVPPFHIPATNENNLRDLVREIAAEYHPIGARPGEDALFGPNNDRPVTKIEDRSGKLHELHERFLLGLGSVGCNDIDMTYAGERYSPHFTWQRGVFPPTQFFSIDTLSIAKKTDGVKTMLETTRIEY